MLPFKIPVGKKNSMIWISNRKTNKSLMVLVASDFSGCVVFWFVKLPTIGDST